jgi:hypothetical protein
MCRRPARATAPAQHCDAVEQERNRSGEYPRDYLNRDQLESTDRLCAGDSLFPLVAHWTGHHWGRSGNFSLGQEVAVPTPGRYDQALVAQSSGMRAAVGSHPGFGAPPRFGWWGCGVPLLVIRRGNLALTGLGLPGWIVGAEQVIRSADVRYCWTVVVGHDRQLWLFDCCI